MIRGQSMSIIEVNHRSPRPCKQDSSCARTNLPGPDGFRASNRAGRELRLQTYTTSVNFVTVSRNGPIRFLPQCHQCQHDLVCIDALTPSKMVKSPAFFERHDGCRLTK